MKLGIRAERPEDYAKISEINDLAFGRQNEGTLIKRLRGTARFNPALSLVAECNGVIIGHILFDPIQIVSENHACPSLALAPVAVLPAHQNKGIGSRLVKKRLEASKRFGFKSLIVLGREILLEVRISARCQMGHTATLYCP